MTDLSINTTTGLIEPIVFVASPHQDERPFATPIELIVVHGISLPPGQFGDQYIEQFFAGKLNHSAHPYFATISGLRVSSHLLIKRDGQVLQFVPFNKRAWHAGDSCFQGKKACNDFSIGIELEGTDDLAYDARQYASLAKVIKLLRQAYPTIKPENVVGHEHIAPGRKTDPGPAFDWEYLKGILV